MSLFKRACLKNPRTQEVLIFPCIGVLSVDNVLLDLGASINLIPLTMLKKIGDLKVQPTKMQL